MAWFSSNNTNKDSINWIEISSIQELKNSIELSKDKTIVIFKHSTRCAISSMAKSKFERKWNYKTDEITPYYLDLIANRDVSNEIENLLGVQHQSPQLIVIKNKQAVLNLSHNAINAEILREYV